MPLQLMPFRGWRFHLKVVPDLSEVMSPPYDVIDAAERQAYLQQSPYNMVHLILGAEYAEDTETNNRFTRAAALLQRWRRDGVLVCESSPALYVYQQDFTLGGTSLTRTGIFGLARLEDYRNGVIFPHEQTLAGPKADLLRLWLACHANLSPIFALYDDPSRRVEALLAPVLAQPPQVATQWGGMDHRLWVVTDAARIARLQHALHDKVLVIADGHHRYETALALRDTLRQQHGGSQEAALYDYVLMCFVNTADPGLVALPTHRLVRFAPRRRPEDALDRLRAWARVEEQPRPATATTWQAWQHHLETQLRTWRGEEESVLILYSGGDRCFLVAVPAATARLQVRQAGVSEAWKQLDVSVLHYALLPALRQALAAEDMVIDYAKAGSDVLGAVAQGTYDLAVLMRPTPLGRLMAIAQGGERLPPKSTYFYPKLPCGLVLYCFDS
ncbi:MAG: phosphatase [Candidatus Tectimicrobiota bacterium]|nr:MAG: phosphatase [Candidatus Tectomicrobia bacterium]